MHLSSKHTLPPLPSVLEINPDICNMNVDYLIIGQGICGSFLSRYLLEAGCDVLVIDKERPNTASRVASGIINPVTGRRLVKTWEIDKFMPLAKDAYKSWELLLGKPLLTETSILDFPVTAQMHLAFQERMAEESLLGIPANTDQWKHFFLFAFPPGEIKPAFLININALLEGWRSILIEKNTIREEVFYHEELVIKENNVVYRDIKANKILFCDGAAGSQFQMFAALPFVANKGEVIWARIPGLPSGQIYKCGLTIVPWNEDIFWIGSTYEWDFEDDQPTEAFRDRVNNTLKAWLKLPFELLDHKASLRPANMERRPFVGLHPQYSSVGILNGMGTKGCSLAPWFARELANHLIHGLPIHPQADISRFSKILSRFIH